MPKVQTLTDVASKALASLGLEAITNIEDSSEPKSRTCLLFIYDAIEQCQKDFNWQELETTVTLEEDSETDAAGNTRYNLPSNYLDIIEVVGYDAVSWKVSDDHIVVSTSSVPPTIVYQRYEENPAKWGPDLYWAIWHKLAALIAQPLVEDEAAWQKAEIASDRAWTKSTAFAEKKRDSGKRMARKGLWTRSRYNSNWPGPTTEIVGK